MKKKKKFTFISQTLFTWLMKFKGINKITKKEFKIFNISNTFNNLTIIIHILFI